MDVAPTKKGGSVRSYIPLRVAYRKNTGAVTTRMFKTLQRIRVCASLTRGRGSSRTVLYRTRTVTKSKPRGNVSGWYPEISTTAAVESATVVVLSTGDTGTFPVCAFRYARTVKSLPWVGPPMDAPTVVADALLRLGTFLVFLAWVFGSGWLLVVFGRDVYANWGRWQTYPLPDKRAAKHLFVLLTLSGLWAILLWTALVWFTA